MRTLSTLAIALLFCSFAAAQEQPGEEHKMLTKTVGKRTGTMKIFAQGPEADPVSMSFTENNTAILGGLWLESDFAAGPYKGRGTMGYDQREKKFVGTWISNMQSNLAVMEGELNKEKHEIVWKFQDYDQETGKLAEMKSVSSMVPDKPEVFTMYQKDAKTGEYKLIFEMTYDEKTE